MLSLSSGIYQETSRMFFGWGTAKTKGFYYSSSRSTNSWKRLLVACVLPMVYIQRTTRSTNSRKRSRTGRVLRLCLSHRQMENRFYHSSSINSSVIQVARLVTKPLLTCERSNFPLSTYRCANWRYACSNSSAFSSVYDIFAIRFSAFRVCLNN